jgi:hypothetical protein
MSPRGAVGHEESKHNLFSETKERARCLLASAFLITFEFPSSNANFLHHNLRIKRKT